MVSFNVARALGPGKALSFFSHFAASPCFNVARALGPGKAWHGHASDGAWFASTLPGRLARVKPFKGRRLITLEKICVVRELSHSANEPLPSTR